MCYLSKWVEEFKVVATEFLHIGTCKLNLDRWLETHGFGLPVDCTYAILAIVLPQTSQQVADVADSTADDVADSTRG